MPFKVQSERNGKSAAVHGGAKGGKIPVRDAVKAGGLRASVGNRKDDSDCDLPDVFVSLAIRFSAGRA